nr:immunoglobulin light chain junction region [Macaca mulatta]
DYYCFSYADSGDFIF